MENIVIWFIGSNATGKTTQSALFHNFFRDKKSRTTIFQQISNEKKLDWRFSKMSDNTSNLGRFSHPLTVKDELVYLKKSLSPEQYQKQFKALKPLDCCGTDTLQTKQQISDSFREACKITKFVVIEGIMATGKWIEFIKNPDNIVFLFYMDIDLETNLLRLKQRKANKAGVGVDDIVFSEKTIKNITGKVNGFKSLFQRVKDDCDFHMKIDAKKEAKLIHNNIMTFIGKNLK